MLMYCITHPPPKFTLTYLLSLQTFGCPFGISKGQTFPSSYQVNIVPRGLKECSDYVAAKATRIYANWKFKKDFLPLRGPKHRFSCEVTQKLATQVPPPCGTDDHPRLLFRECLSMSTIWLGLYLLHQQTQWWTLWLESRVCTWQSGLALQHPERAQIGHQGIKMVWES